MPSKTTPTTRERRRFLQHSLGTVGASLSLSLLPGHELRAARRFGSDPFTLGVASGDPAPDGIALWTRLAPVPAEPGHLGAQRIPVRWQVATDAAMQHVVARGVAAASPELAHSVHVEVRGLLPGRDYFYRFSVRAEESAIGHFRTAPADHEMLRELRFAFVTCQDWASGYFTAYRDMLANDLDLVLHLGDYTYEYRTDTTLRRGSTVPPGFENEAVDLRTYRLRHTLYKLDRDLQAVHAKFPFASIWDDHEVANDYSGRAPEYAAPSPAFSQRRLAAYQAWYEHMPIRLSTGPASQHPSLRLYRRLRYGALAQFDLLDDRRYRSDNPCGDGESLRCEAALNGHYTMLGRHQEEWLARGFERSHARWNIIAQQLLMAELEHATIRPNWYWNDAWDGYPKARERLLNDVLASKLRNPVVLSGDWHSTFVNDLKLNFKDPNPRPIATEFVTPALTTGGDATPYGPYYGPMVPYNPHIKFYEGDKRGYFKATLAPSEMRVDLRYVTSVESAAGKGYAAGSWIVQDGRAGAQPT
jgi:alkaline phosphatase D